MKNLIKILSLFILFGTSIVSSFAIFWFENVKDWLKWDIIKDPNKIEWWIIDIVWYLLNYIYIIAFIWILWSGFQIMTAAWDDEKVKTWKNRIIYVFVWIVVIFLAFQITTFVLDGLKVK